MSPRSAAEQAGVTRLTVLKWIKTGRLPASPVSTLHGPGYDIKPEDLKSLLDARAAQRGDAERARRQGSAIAEIRSLREFMEDELRSVRDRLAGLEASVAAVLDSQVRAANRKSPGPDG